FDGVCFERREVGLGIELISDLRLRRAARCEDKECQQRDRDRADLPRVFISHRLSLLCGPGRLESERARAGRRTPQTSTVTRRKVAGMEVVDSLPLWFWRAN